MNPVLRKIKPLIFNFAEKIKILEIFFVFAIMAFRWEKAISYHHLASCLFLKHFVPCPRTFALFSFILGVSTCKALLGLDGKILLTHVIATLREFGLR